MTDFPYEYMPYFNMKIAVCECGPLGNTGQAAHAAAMAAKRAFCQSLSHEYASQGIHVAHVVLGKTKYKYKIT